MQDLFKREWVAAYVIKKKYIKGLSGKGKLTNAMID